MSVPGLPGTMVDRFGRERAGVSFVDLPTTRTDEDGKVKGKKGKAVYFQSHHRRITEFESTEGATATTHRPLPSSSLR